MLHVEIDEKIRKEAEALRASMNTEIEKAMYMQALMLDKRIKICLRPKPRFMPTWLWKKIIGRLLYSEEIH